jgi:glycosyl transferase family 25
MNREEQIKQLYSLVLQRPADESGLKHYLNSDKSLVEIQDILAKSDEFLSKFNVPYYDLPKIENKIPIFIINLHRRNDRRTEIQKRLDGLGINNYEFVLAIDGDELTKDTSPFYNKDKSLELQRQLTTREIACALSHTKCLKTIIDNNLPYGIIMEDDAIPNLLLNTFLKNFESFDGDTLLLGYFSSNEWANEKLKTTEAPIKVLEPRSIIYLQEGQNGLYKLQTPSLDLDFIHGAHAYLVSNKGARKMLEINYPVIVEADNIWNYFNLDIKVLYPMPVNRQWLDSDLQNQRSEKVIENISSPDFERRFYHPNFGT